MRIRYWIAGLVVALGLAAGLVACGGDDGDASDTPATTERTAEDAGQGGQPDGDSGETDGATDEEDPESDASGPARSEQIDELLTLHPVFAAKRFLNFAANGNPSACSLLSARGRRAMRAAHGASCEDTIRAAAASHDEPGLTIGGEFVPVDEISDMEFRTTIYVFKREQGRVSIDGERRPMILRQYGRIWLIDSVPLAEIGTGG